ncbi:MAG TPA: dihydrodipicolinate synthase family protein [Tepidisphaeraceae bacterium]|nr:dihydrodipicolinate synthase family protein [Tepidisphaeraceae bacterium]
MKHQGVVVPIVSPFSRAGEVDVPAVGRIVELLISHRIGGIFPLGTTGEAASISSADRRAIVEATMQATRGRATVYAGIAGNCFSDSVGAARDYKALGVHAVVAHMPSYYPLNDTEIEAYFLRLADAVPLPLVLYNIPVTTHHHIALGSVDRLREHGNIVAIKDSASDPARLTELLKRTGGRGSDFPVLLGSSACFAHGLRAGGSGLVPSGAHVVPGEYQAMYEAALTDNWPEVDRLQHLTDTAVAPYLKGKSVGQGLAALKAMLEQRGVCGRTMLSPLLDAPAD